MRYRHKQVAPVGLLLGAAGTGMLVVAALSRGDAVLWVTGLAGSVVFFTLASCFHHLAVEDRGSYLSVRFGPLPIFGTRIPFDSITAAEAGKSRVIDGWGIHFVPGRGWTWNLWGFGCVIIHCGPKIIRIGTDEPQKLAAFLTHVIGKHAVHRA